MTLGVATLVLCLAGAVLSVDARAQAKKKKGADAAPAQQDTAAAQRAYAAGAKAFETGDMAGAEQQLSVALSSGGLPNAQMARALYLRGAASRRLGKPAQAISDLTTAVWLKGGLSDTDKAKATEERQLAYREAGLGDTPPPIGAAPLDQSTKSAAGSAPAAKPGSQVVQVTEQSFWSNFSLPTLPSLTGSSQPAQTAEATPAQPQQQSSFWSFLSPGPSQPDAGASAAAPTLGIAPSSDGAQTGVPGSLTGSSAPIVPASWETQTASADAPVSQPVSAGYAPQPAPETSINPMGAVAPTPSSQTSLSNPLEGTGTAVSNFFGNMFSSGTPAQPATPVMTGSTEQTPHWGAETTVVTAQTSSMVQRGPDSPPAPSSNEALPWGSANASSGPATAPAAPVKVAAAPASGGKYKLQVAAVRSREEAERLAQSLTGYQPVRDGMVSPEIDEAVIGSMGTFYRVRLGPYADAKEPNQLCKTLKPQGFDCLVVTQ
ncbi:MAG: SPOR domain-containing protein [Rhizobiales bacterium]|nr:SPOR domain-containing protein [Hyphomicrobiales bacterium]